MELTLREVLKSRKVRNVNGYYPYQLLLDTVRHIYSQVNALDTEILSVLEHEYKIASNFNLFKQKTKIEDHEVYDFYLLHHLCYPSYWPLFVVNQDLCESLYQTSCNKNLIISRPFVDQGIILMPKTINNESPTTAIYVFAKEKDTKTGKENIQVCCLTSLIGSRGVEFFELNTSIATKKEQKNKIDFLFNLFLYKESVKNTPTETELVIPQSRGFGSAKNTNQKQIITPRMIGADYKPKTIRQESTGTHASPTTHWRSGHWRQQLIGKRETPDHKTIWIEPVLVNG